MTTPDHYSQHARNALLHAEGYVRRMQHGVVDTDHLLLGILYEPECLGAVALHDLNLDLVAFELELLRLRAGQPRTSQNELPLFSDELTRALEYAVEEAAWLGKGYIGTEHILLGLVGQPGSRAAALLSVFAITPGQVQRMVRHLSEAGYVEISLAEARKMARFSEMARRILNGAEAEAQRREHPHVAIEHVLLILLQDQRNVAGRVMREIGTDQALLDVLLNEAVELAPLDEALSMAVALAIRMGDHYTGSDHLLLAIASDLRGSWVLATIGLKPDQVQRRLRELMDEARE